MRHGSLFSGIGGFDLAAEWMGWENVFHCEWNPFGQRVLKYYWPNAKSYEDITKTDFTIHRGSIDILTGGFPCQPYSMAGKRKGKADERHLWPEMLRAVREIAPSYIVGENVLGLVNWDGGLVFDEVQADLEAEGYEVAAVVIPAAAVNAPHGRDRVWFVAYNKSARITKDINKWRESKPYNRTEVWSISNAISKSGLAADANSNGQHECNCDHEINAGEGREYALGNIGAGDDDGDAADSEQQGRKEWRQIDGWENTKEDKTGLHHRIERLGNDGDAANTRCTELQGSKFERSIGKKRKIESHSRQSGRPIRTTWEEFPTQSPICGGDDGLSRELDGITFSKWRNESIRAYGNAIVPHVAFEIFKVIQIIEDQYERPIT